MPLAPPRLCPTCRAVVPAGQRCPRCRKRQHQEEQARRKGQGRTREARGYGEAYRALRLRVLARDHHRCRYCGAVATTVDHVVPLTAGGENSLGNLLSSCLKCNLARRPLGRGGRRSSPTTG